MTIATTETSLPQRQIEQDFRWNFIVNALDGASFWFGMSFISSTIILPLYVSHFTSHPMLIGLIPFLSTAGYLLPQIFMANAVARAPKKKFFPVVIGFFTERVPIFLLAPTTYFLATDHPSAALSVFFVLLAWHTLGAGTIIVGWQDMIAKIFSVRHRGRFFGITNFVGNGAGILGALAVPFVLDRFPFPVGYVVSFSAAAVLILLSWCFIALTREPAVTSKRPAISQLDYLRSLPAVLRRDRNFRMYLLTKVVLALSGMATGFLTVYAVQTWALRDAQASGFTIALQIGLALSNLFFGFLADRKGHKLSLQIGITLSVLLQILALTALGPSWFFVIFFLLGAVNASTTVSGISIVYEFTDEDDRPTYIGLTNTVSGLAGTIAPLVGGWLVGVAGYQAMFALAAAIGLISWGLLRFTVTEPRTING